MINKRAGGTGMITGRKAFQRPMKEGVGIIQAVQDVYLSDEISNRLKLVTRRALRRSPQPQAAHRPRLTLTHAPDQAARSPGRRLRSKPANAR